MYRLNKGIDRPPVVLGVQGMNYLMILGGLTVGGLFFVMLVIVLTHLNASIVFGVYLAFLVGAYQFVGRKSRQYGERGFSKYRARRSFPRVVKVRTSAVYNNLRTGSAGSGPVTIFPSRHGKE